MHDDSVPFDLLISEGTVLTRWDAIQDGAVAVCDGLISYVGTRGGLPPLRSGSITIDAHGGWITPGLIDLHLHGAGGHDVATDLAGVADFLARHGVTAFLPTLVPAPTLSATVARLANEIKAGVSGAVPIGLHLEGPCLSAQQSGGLDAKRFLLPRNQALDGILAAGNGLIRRMTLAVELPGADDLLRELLGRGIAPSLGHSEATFEEVIAAVRLGLRQATHTFNAMAPFHHRSPGPALAVLLCDDIVAEVIADGAHLHHAVIDLLRHVKGIERLVLVSDAAPPAGLAASVAEWAGQPLVVSSGACRTSDGRLVGSATLLDGALRYLITSSLMPERDAIAMATSTPARAIGLQDRKGSLETGMDADVAVFDRDWRCLATVIGGRVAYSAG